MPSPENNHIWSSLLIKILAIVFLGNTHFTFSFNADIINERPLSTSCTVFYITKEVSVPASNTGQLAFIKTLQ